MEKEISETYHFNPLEFTDGCRADGVTFREVVREFERDFHFKHPADYALLLYSNSSTMHLLERGNGAAPFLSYGLDLMAGPIFRPQIDGDINYQIDRNSTNVIVYGIDSAFMNQLDDDGDPIFGEANDIYPLTLLINNSIGDGTIRLAIPDDDDDDCPEPVLIDHPTSTSYERR